MRFVVILLGSMSLVSACWMGVVHFIQIIFSPYLCLGFVITCIKTSSKSTCGFQQQRLVGGGGNHLTSILRSGLRSVCSDLLDRGL